MGLSPPWIPASRGLSCGRHYHTSFHELHTDGRPPLDAYAWILLLLGFTSGTLNSSIGLGWGVVNIPVLMMLPTLTARQAIALSLVTGIFANGAATFENARHSLVPWSYAIMMGLGGIG